VPVFQVFTHPKDIEKIYTTKKVFKKAPALLMLAVIESWAYHYSPGQGIGAEFDFLSVWAKLI
jgi:hypothetical protein